MGYGTDQELSFLYITCEIQMGMSHSQLGMSMEIRGKSQARDTNDQFLGWGQGGRECNHSIPHSSAVNQVYIIMTQT